MQIKVNEFGNVEEARQLNTRKQEIVQKINEIDTPALAKIKRVLNYMNFGYIQDQEQLDLNQAKVILKQGKQEVTEYGCDVTYYIRNKRTALVYANFKPKYKDGELVGHKVNYPNESNYAYFVADLLDEKIIFSKEFDCFIKINRHNQTFEVIDEAYFKYHYPVQAKQGTIKHFLPVFEELYRIHIQRKHNYTIRRYAFYTNDFIYDMDKMLKENRKPLKNELFFAYYDVSNSELNTDLVKEFKKKIVSNDDTLHNLNLMHTYIMRRKIGLEPAEKFFLFKDKGRTGKGLFVKTFNTLFKVNKLNLPTLTSSAIFERNNEHIKAYDCEVVHINEAEKITSRDMNVLRPIATNEWLTARNIGGDSFVFKPFCTMIIDTNGEVEVGELKANVSRMVNLALKDRPMQETEAERHKVFKPYWEYIAPDGNNVPLASALSFLVESLEYFKAQGSKFVFKEVQFERVIKNEAFDYIYSTLKAMQKTQQDKTPFILASDPRAKELLEQCYGRSNAEIERKRTDFSSKGIELNKLKKIDGKPTRVHCIVNADALHDYFN